MSLVILELPLEQSDKSSRSWIQILSEGIQLLTFPYVDEGREDPIPLKEGHRGPASVHAI